MSASSGIVAKGEKGKSKFQSLDINNLYKATENEPTQQKGTLLRAKNGMQSLGKVPTARRPPANLPSLKSENSGNEPAVSLVPAGAAGWGSKPGEGPPSTQQPPVPTSNTGTMPPQPAPVAVVAPVVMVPPTHEQVMHNMMPGADKSWSAIMAREQVPPFLAHQSPQFQQEFPKLASEGVAGVAGKPGDAQYGPGPSLRPQTEGSWTSGGGRPPPGGPLGQTPQSLVPGHHGPAGPEPGGVRTNLGPHPAVGAGMGPGGPGGMPFPAGTGYRPIPHNFMMPRPGSFVPPMAGIRQRFPGPGYPLDGRFPPGRGTDGDDPVTRPIIRDEELNKMDEIARDPGWAASEDIDYNQQLAFSDNEENEGDSSKKDARKDRNDKNRGKDEEKFKDKPEIDRRSEERNVDKRNTDWDRGGRHRGYPSGADDDRRKPREDDSRKQRESEDERRKIREAEDVTRKIREMEEERRKHRELEEERRKEEENKRKVREEVAAACQLSRQRKDDELRRFDESKRSERREWDQKREGPDAKRDDHRESKRDNEHGKFDRDVKRDTEHGKREGDHAKFERDGDGKYERDGKRESEHGKRDDHGKYDYRGRMDGRDFRQGSRPQQYKQLPPRLQAQADRMNSQHRSTASPQPAPTAVNNFESHWTHGRRYGGESGEENRDRHTPDTYSDRYKSAPGRDRYPDRHSFNESDHRRHTDRKERESESERSEDSYKKSRDSEQGARPAKEASSEREAWRAPTHNEREEEQRRPQRPDSRDSRTSRDSRNSREDKHDSDSKLRNTPAQHKEEKLDVKGPPKHAATPPRELQDSDKKPSQPSPAPSPKIDTQSVITDEHHKDDRDDKSSPQDDSKQKGGKSARGNRWGSGTSTTYVRNGSRGERRRRTSGGSYSRPENESGSSGEGGSELDKGEKEERNKETRRGDGTGRDGFAPSGQPSRRGRGAARVRGGGSANVPRRMDGGYGPPPIKATFSQPEPPAPVEEEEEDPTKQKQAALNAGIAGGAAKATAAAAAAAAAVSQRSGGAARPQRTSSNRDANRPKTNRSRRPGGKTAEGEEAWETNSEGEDRKPDRAPRRGPAQPRGPPSSARSTTNRGPPASSGQKENNRPSSVPTDVKEEKLSESKSKITDNDGDSSQTSGSTQGDRGKKAPRDSFKGKSENRVASGNGSGNGGPNKDRQDRRVKPTTNQPAPAVNTTTSNTSGPQPLMSQVVNPPMSMTKTFGGGNTWRQATALPPRLQKQHDQQRQQANDVSHDLSKMVPSSIFPTKGESLSSRDSAWEKPMGPTSRSPADQGPSETSSQRSSPGNKLPIRENVLLDDSVPPVNTIIFENTNLKSGPGAFSSNLKQPPTVPKANEWKASEELFGKSELSVEPLPDHSIKPPLYRAEQGIEIENLLHTELPDLTDMKNAESFKRLADVKNLWADEQPNSFQAPFRQDSTIDSGFGKTVDAVVTPDDCLINPAEVVYSPAPPSYGITKHDPNNSSNVCKVKPQQQAVLTTGHSPLGHTGQSPLSPPPFNSTQQGQFNYQQAGLSGNPAQFSGMPAIPSPPAALSFSSQQLQQSGLFPFQLDRNQFSTQYSGHYGLSAASLSNTSTFNQPHMYLSTHPAQQTEIFSSMSQYRVPHASPHANPNTVMIPQNSNSLMSANVKPSSQNIGVIGSKASPYQQNSQMYFPFTPVNMNQSYLTGSGMLQRSANVQSAAPEFYSNSPGPQTSFYTTPGSGLGQPMPSLQQSYARQSYVNQSTTHNMPNYSSPVHMDMAYRNPGGVGPASYMKSGVGNNSVPQQDVLSSVFNSGPKPRPVKQMGQPPPQQSPTQTSSNKFGNYSNANQLGQQQSQQNVNHQRMPQSNMGLQGMRSAPRYPSPIQRPQSYRGRSNPHQQQRPGAKPYFEAQEGKLDEPSDLSKAEETSQLNCEPKLPEPVQPAKTDGPDEDAAPLKE